MTETQHQTVSHPRFPFSLFWRLGGAKALIWSSNDVLRFRAVGNRAVCIYIVLGRDAVAQLTFVLFRSKQEKRRLT